MYTKLRQTPYYILLPLFIAVYIPCSIVVLVPIDLVSSSKQTTLFYLSEEVRLVLWRVIYWLAFFLTWAVLPILQSFIDSGYHSTTQRLKDAGRRNLRYQLIMLGAGSIGLVYVIITSGLTFGTIKSLLIALSHSYALVIALWLMGHGLVNLPRRYWVEASPAVTLKGFYQHATSANDAIAEIQTEYADVAAEVLALRPHKSGRYEAWIDEMLEEVQAGPGVPLNSAANSRESVQGQSRVRVDRGMVDEYYLSTLYSRFKTFRNRLVRYDAEWQKLLYEASKAEDIIKSRETHSLVFRYKRTPLPPKAAYLFYALAKPQIERGLAVVFLVLTVILVWSEITHGTIVSIVNIVVSHTYGLGQQVMSTIFLGYMCTVALSSLTRIRVFKVYALVHRHTDPSSLIFYAMYACRLTVPLSFNYITLITSRESVFQEFLGKFINLTPLGKYFNDWMPRFILVPMIFTLFHVYDRIKDFLGFGFSFDDDDEEEEERGSVVEGREIVRRSLTDPSYRFSLRHPNVSATASTGGDLEASTPRISISESDTPRRLQLGGGQVNRNRNQDQDAEAEQYHPEEDEGLDTRLKGFFTSLGGRLQAGFSGIKLTSDTTGILPQWNRNGRQSTDYQDHDDGDDGDYDDGDDEQRLII